MALGKKTENNHVILKWSKLSPDAKIPDLASVGAACFDLSACMTEPMLLKKGQVVAVPTQLSVEVPEGYELQLRARSGLAFKHGVTLVNGVGTIDSDYRGEIKILLTLLADDELLIQPGDRVAQALVSRVLPVVHMEVESLSETVRGTGGFGSTGLTT